MPFPSPGDLLEPEIKHGFPALQADSLPSEPLGGLYYYMYCVYVCVYIYIMCMSSHIHIYYIVYMNRYMNTYE